MVVRTLSPVTVRGRAVPAGAPINLMDHEAEPLIAAGLAEPWQAPPRAGRDEVAASRAGVAAEAPAEEPGA